MGPSVGVPGQSSMVSLGMGGISRFVEAVENVVRRVGGNGRKRLEELSEVVARAWLVSVNDSQPNPKLGGGIRVIVPKTTVRAIVEHVNTRVKRAADNIKIVVKRLK